MRKIAKILGIENLGFGIRETTLCAAHIFHLFFSKAFSKSFKDSKDFITTGG